MGTASAGEEPEVCGGEPWSLSPPPETMLASRMPAAQARTKATATRIQVSRSRSGIWILALDGVFSLFGISVPRSGLRNGYDNYSTDRPKMQAALFVSGQAGQQSLESQPVALPAEPTDLPETDRGDNRPVAKRFAGVDVR